MKKAIAIYKWIFQFGFDIAKIIITTKDTTFRNNLVFISFTVKVVIKNPTVYRYQLVIV